jgi:hypothetical protein
MQCLLFVAAMSHARRLTVAILATQLAFSATPAGVLLVCISADGRASIEVAAPGTTRCAEADCERAQLDAEGHCCHDIPVVLSAQALHKVSAATLTPPLLSSTAMIAPAAQALLVGRAASVTSYGPPPTIAALRSVILTL